MEDIVPRIYVDGKVDVSDFIDGTPIKVQEFLFEIMKKTQIHWHDLRIGTDEDYDGTYIYVYFRRLENDKEYEKRLDAIARQSKHSEVSSRRQKQKREKKEQEEKDRLRVLAAKYPEICKEVLSDSEN